MAGTPAKAEDFATAAKPALALVDLNKAYGALKVTDHVSLEFAPGELHAIIGPNGAGKTTLIHQISGLAGSDSGHILLDGQDITGLPMAARVRKGLARSFQITSIIPGFTGLENVALAVQARLGSSFRLFGAVAREERLNAPARTILETVGLLGRADLPAGLLSHGEKRQLELAIAAGTEVAVAQGFQGWCQRFCSASGKLTIQMSIECRAARLHGDQQQFGLHISAEQA